MTELVGARLRSRGSCALPLTLAVFVALAVAGCGTTPQAQPPTAAPATTGASPAATLPNTTPPEATGIPYRVTYGWGVPSRPVTVSNPVTVPITPPPGIPLPYLVEIRTGDHPDFARITFAFRGAFPEYTLQYVARLEAEGSGNPVPLPGNAVLRVGFVNAQAHDDAGASTIRFAASRTATVGNLVGYAAAGDFEGHVTYGLGIRVAPNSDQVLDIRAGQQQRPDGLYVVAIDVRKG